MKKIFSFFKRKRKTLYRKVYEWDERSGLGWIVAYGVSEEECDSKYYNHEYVIEEYFFGKPVGFGSDNELDTICNHCRGNRVMFKISL